MLPMMCMLCMLLSGPEPWLLPSTSQRQLYTAFPIPKLLTSIADLTLHAASHHAVHALLSHHPQSNPARPDWHACLLGKTAAAAVAAFSTAVVAAERDAEDWSAPANTRTDSSLEVASFHSQNRKAAAVLLRLNATLQHMERSQDCTERNQ